MPQATRTSPRSAGLAQAYGNTTTALESRFAAGSESLAGAAEGLDNDGDGIYDLDDSDCTAGPDASVIDAGVIDAAGSTQEPVSLSHLPFWML